MSAASFQKTLGLCSVGAGGSLHLSLNADMDALKSLYESGFILEAEYLRRKALIAAEDIAEDSDSEDGGAPSKHQMMYGVPLQEYKMEGSEPVASSVSAPLYKKGDVVYDVLPSVESLSSQLQKHSKSRSVRLFISSTFKDMKQEREALVKIVFPEIRKLCAARKVNFVYIDFRWGITREESSGGKVLDLCLAEIDKCRPYFIGMLGDRYGWSQASSSIIDKTLQATFDDAMQKHEWVDFYRDRSITELEMLYGCLFHPSQSRAHFYIRDSSFNDNLDFITRRDYECSSHGEKVRLQDLKARIYASDIPVVEYSSISKFTEQVLKDLKKKIEQDFPDEEAASLDEWDLQKNAQYNLVVENQQLYVHRNSYDQMLNNYISSSTSPYVGIFGAIGSGKSALLQNWCFPFISSQLSKSQSNVYVIYRNIGMFSIKIHKIVTSILVELKREFPKDIHNPIPSDKDEIVHSLSEFLTLASVSTHIVLVLDGIEKLQDIDLSLNWLPTSLPSKVSIVLSCPNGSKPFQVLSSKEFEHSSSSSKPQISAFEVGEMKDAERRDMIIKFLSQCSKKLGHEQIYLLSSSRRNSNPLFLKYVLEQLRTFGEYDNLTEYITKLLSNGSISQLLSNCLDSWNKEFKNEDESSSQFVVDVFGLLCASRGGLLESELSSILHVSQQTLWTSLLDACSFVLNNQGGLISLANVYIQDACKPFICNAVFNSSSNQNQRAQHLALGDIDDALFEKALAGFRSKIYNHFDSKSLGPRKIYELPFQAVKLGKAAAVLPAFLSNLQVFEMMYTDSNKLDLSSYWNSAGAQNMVSLYKAATSQLSATTNDHKRKQGALLFNLGKFLLEQGQAKECPSFYDGALKIYNQLYGSNSIQVAELLHGYAILQEILGLYNDAYEKALKSYNIFQVAAGKDSPKTASSVWLQGLLQKKLNNYDKAIELFRSALQVSEAYYGPKHPTVALYLAALGDVYRNQALYDKAEEIYRRALEINRQTFGEFHPKVAELLADLGRIEKKKGNYDIARPLYEQSISILTKMFGANHFSLAEIYVQMADVYRKIGENSRSEELYNKALSIYIPQLGEEHPDVGEIYYLLGLTHKQTGAYEESIQCSLKAIYVAEKAFGNDHLKVAAPVGSLADVYSITAKYSEAVQLYLRALKINESKLGKDHPECSENLNALGMISKKRGRYQEAKEYYLRSLQIVEKAFGPDHPKVAMYIHNLGVIHRKLRDYNASQDAFQRALKINKSTFGEDHPMVAGNLIGVALAIVKSGGNLDEARDILLKVIQIFENKLGPNHEKVALALNYLAEVYRKQGLFGRGGAETSYERALKINKQVYGDWNDHPEIAENLNGLAQVYKAQMNYTKAEPLFKTAIEMSERTLGVNHPHVINRYRNLSLMYEAQGNVSKAQQIQAKIEELKAMPPLEGE